MGFQRSASLMLVSAAVGSGATAVYFVGAYDLLPRQATRAVEQPKANEATAGRRAVLNSGRTRIATASEIASVGQRKRLTVPVSGIKRSQLSDNFADPRDAGLRAHEGIDIMAPAGTEVLSAASGVIEKLFTSEKGGLTLYVRSTDGLVMYYYAHLSGYVENLQAGQEVKEGEVIGYVGSTGNADPLAPHLHFGVLATRPEANWGEGAPINPYPLLH